jgi:hypothetical protein
VAKTAQAARCECDGKEKQLAVMTWHWPDKGRGKGDASHFSIAWGRAAERTRKTVGALHGWRYHSPIAADARRRRRSGSSEVMRLAEYGIHERSNHAEFLLA